MSMLESKKAEILKKLDFVYGKDRSSEIYSKIEKLAENFQGEKIVKKDWIDEKDVYLITYGDSIKNDGENPLKTLHSFLDEKLKGIVNNVHILPFYPFTSDDGFSVVDYFKINEELGNWNDVQELSKDYKLMFDAVINHISAKSDWFQGFLNGDSKYSDYFITIDKDDKIDEELKKVTRPRALPLLTEFDTKNGKKRVWTTFSEDQIDINFENEEVFLEILRLLLFYVEMGATSIRLDAIGFLWKEIGTTCIHLEQTHKVIQIYKDLFDIVAPQTILITETNVPHKDNISYFGNGKNEAKMVYQFPLPPLTVHTLQTGDATAITKWASSLEQISEETTFFNFLASHDGVGVVPATGLLTEEEISNMIEKVKCHGGLISYKNLADGSQKPYEMNVNFLESLSHPDTDIDLRVKKFLSAHAILLSLIGVPAIYVHSMLGSLNYHEGVNETGRNRTINREKLDFNLLMSELDTEDTLRHQVFAELTTLIKVRTSEKAFNPISSQKVLNVDKNVFAMIRESKDKESKVLFINNISDMKKDISIELNNFNDELRNIINDHVYKVEDGVLHLTLDTYEFLWLK